MIAYLDYNVIVSLIDREFSIDKIYEKVDKNIKHFPYSAAHIQEVDNLNLSDSYQRDTFINERLTKIHEVTNDLYLFHELPGNQVYFLTEHPSTVLTTIRQALFAKPSMQSFTSLIPSSFNNTLRNILGIKPIELNQYRPQEVIKQLDEKLTVLGPNYSFFEFIEKSVSLFPNANELGLHNRIAAAFKLLDMFGYWKDKEAPTSDYARLWDSNHAYFASHCDYFISDDKRARYKTRVVYHLYNISTKVISSDGGD